MITTFDIDTFCFWCSPDQRHNHSARDSLANQLDIDFLCWFSLVFLIRIIRFCFHTRLVFSLCPTWRFYRLLVFVTRSQKANFFFSFSLSSLRQKKSRSYESMCVQAAIRVGETTTETYKTWWWRRVWIFTHAITLTSKTKSKSGIYKIYQRNLIEWIFWMMSRVKPNNIRSCVAMQFVWIRCSLNFKFCIK